MFEEIKAKEIEENIFKLVDKDWMLITAKKGDKVNAMTASWGGFGIIWGREVAWIVIRQSRYTKEFVDEECRLSLDFFDHDSNKKMLGYMGTVSGRDEDKIKKTGLTVKYDDGTPYFDESKLVFICRKLASYEIGPEGFIDGTIDRQWYSDKDYHTMYIVEIEKVLKDKEC